MIFADQDFKVPGFPGVVISGKDVLEDVFGQERDVSAWGMFGVLVAWIFFFRFVHYVLFHNASAPFLRKEESPTRVNRTLAISQSSELSKNVTYEMVSPQQATPIDAHKNV